jgi:beta-phosphoglucomutase-like phosphatase (HAD superfamily)
MFGLPDGVSACLFDMDGAVTGVEAGRAGHFALVVGVARVGQAEELAKHGAGIVVQDLAELLDKDVR